MRNMINGDLHITVYEVSSEVWISYRSHQSYPVTWVRYWKISARLVPRLLMKIGKETILQFMKDSSILVEHREWFFKMYFVTSSGNNLKKENLEKPKPIFLQRKSLPLLFLPKHRNGFFITLYIIFKVAWKLIISHTCPKLRYESIKGICAPEAVWRSVVDLVKLACGVKHIHCSPPADYSP